MDREKVDARRRELHSLLGELPPRNGPVGVEVLAVENHEGYIRETLILDLNGIEPVPAYLTRPHNHDGPLPAVVYTHAHGGDWVLGKDEFIAGRDALQSPPYAAVLASRGIAGICIDTWNFGERRGRTESALFKELLWRGQVLWGMMVHDTLRVTDYLVSRADIDATRIGSMGLSMGSTMAWWHAALDDRVIACVDICCLTDFDALIETGRLDGHGIYYYVPSLLRHFTAAQINALISPRAHLSLAGIHDPLTPPAGLDRIDRELQAVYASAGVPDRWQLFRSQTGHYETHAMRTLIVQFLDRYLLGQ